ncbi:hypothetical protein NHJ6243_010121, partial [Beauveria neobassiana]
MADNGSEACIFHIESDYDSEFWADYDESVHGDIDTKRN